MSDGVNNPPAVRRDAAQSAEKHDEGVGIAQKLYEAYLQHRYKHVRAEELEAELDEILASGVENPE